MKRRDFLKVLSTGALSLALPSCNKKLFNLFGPEDEKLWGLNVHPYSGEAFDLQIRALNELGIRRIRMTLGLGRDLASPYFSSYPAEYLGIVSDFNLSHVTPRNWPGMVRNTVSRAGNVSRFEVLNEPDHQRMSPEIYVRDYLEPAYQIIKEMRPEATVVAAAPTGTSGGRVYFYQMTDHGADRFCDRRGVHLYQNNPEIYLLGTDRPFSVTETGKRFVHQHVSWWTDEMPHIGKVLDTDQLYFYVLLDRPDVGYSLIASTGSREGNVRPVSPLYEHIRNSEL